MKPLENITNATVRSLLQFIRDHIMEAFLNERNFDSYEEYIEEAKASWEDHSDEWKASHPFRETVCTQEEMFNPDITDFYNSAEAWAVKNSYSGTDYDRVIAEVGGFAKLADYLRAAKQTDISITDRDPVYSWLYYIALGAFEMYCRPLACKR